MTSSSASSPRAAIIIRTRDRERLLRRAIDDLLAQTFSRWAAVIVNDGGDRKAVDDIVAERADALAGRLAVVHNDTSRGMEAASNRGLIAVEGDLVAIHDDDDTWDPEFLATTIAWLDEHPDDVAVAVATDIVIERIDGDDASELSRQTTTPPFARLSLFDLILANRIPPIGMLLRRSALDALGGFDETLFVLGDWDITLRLALEGPIGYIDGEALAFWRQRPDGAGASSNSVFGQAHAHRRTDREIRDRAIRDYVSRNGIGDLLYLSRFIDERFAESRHETWARIGEIELKIEESIRAQTEQIESVVRERTQFHSVPATMRRVLGRLAPRRRRQPAG